jgi:hypothetical protein
MASESKGRLAGFMTILCWLASRVASGVQRRLGIETPPTRMIRDEFVKSNIRDEASQGYGTKPD